MKSQTLPEVITVETVAELRRVVKRYGRLVALHGIDLRLSTGEVVALLGPNGAGKSTAINVLLGLRAPDEGLALLFGEDARSVDVRARIGATPQETSFPETLRVREVVELVQAHYPKRWPSCELLDRFQLGEVANRLTGGLSGGQKRRLAVALAFAGKPEAVFLDEPTTGLDVAARQAVWEAIRTFVCDGGSVLLTTHYMEEVEALATRVVLVNHGRVVAQGDPSQIRAQVGLSRISFRLTNPESLTGFSSIVRQDTNGSQVNLYCRDPDSAVRELVSREIPFEGIRVEPVSLEEAFLALTGGHETDEACVGTCAG